MLNLLSIKSNEAIEFINRRGDIYFLKTRLTKNGNRTNFITKKQSEDCLSQLPQAYEVFEKYDLGVMYIRKVIKSEFTEKEINIVKKRIGQEQNDY